MNEGREESFVKMEVDFVGRNGIKCPSACTPNKFQDLQVFERVSRNAPHDPYSVWVFNGLNVG